MKILFIESRTQTEQWDKVAKLLESKNDISIHWIVCSKVVKPVSGSVSFISFPSDSDLEPIDDANLDLLEIRASDRIIKYYFGGDEHYNYYWSLLYKKVVEISPDIVFGELANFHTHMVQRICKILEIDFYQPSTVRYPTQRFGFYKGDRLELAELDREVSDQEIKLANETAERIAVHSIQPDYMKAHSNFWVRAKHGLRKYGFKLSLFYHWMAGDRYNVPSPLATIRNSIKAKGSLKAWISNEAVLETLAAETRKVLLYPLQMQPEFNLDVWGREFNCQIELISKIKDSLPDDWILAVKLNPKSFLELDDSLVAMKDIIRLPYRSMMYEILPEVDAVITVTGTIAIECSVRNIPILVLGQSDFAALPNVVSISHPNELREIDSLLEEKRRLGSEGDVILRLVKNSYRGVIGERITNPLP